MSTDQSPRSILVPGMPPMTMAGYIVGSIIEACAPPPKEMGEEFMTIAKGLSADMGFKKIFLGPALNQYEYAAGTPNVSFVIKFASKAKALEFYDSEAYQAWRAKHCVGTKILRDLRIIEAPADLFIEGRAYWLALIREQPDPARNMKYIQACEINGNMETKPWDVTLKDGTVVKTSLSLKWLGPSHCKEEALNLLPSEQNATDFFGISTSDGIVVIAEFPTHEQGACWKECLAYKNALLSSMDETYTTEEAYQASLKTFMAEIFQRDVRIIGI